MFAVTLIFCYLLSTINGLPTVSFGDGKMTITGDGIANPQDPTTNMVTRKLISDGKWKDSLAFPQTNSMGATIWVPYFLVAHSPKTANSKELYKFVTPYGPNADVTKDKFTFSKKSLEKYIKEGQIRMHTGDKRTFVPIWKRPGEKLPGKASKLKVKKPKLQTIPEDQMLLARYDTYSDYLQDYDDTDNFDNNFDYYFSEFSQISYLKGYKDGFKDAQHHPRLIRLHSKKQKN